MLGNGPSGSAEGAFVRRRRAQKQKEATLAGAPLCTYA